LAVGTPFPERKKVTAVEGEHPLQSSSVNISSRRAPFSPGSVIAEKYRVEHELAEGGLGIIVVATHAGLGQKVAIKYLKPSVLERPVLVERFRHEAQLAASIRSDHVVRIYDVGVLDGAGPYMVMEYLEGEDLGTRLSRGPVPTLEAIDYIVQTCDALAEAHAMGIVHRDLKPENLFLARRKGSVPILKVLDFGISKVSERKHQVVGAPRARQVTEEGERFGTPAYMSPEQLRHSGNVDIRADIWALGVVLFELLTGVLPFAGEAVADLGASILRSAPTSLLTKLPDASPALDAIILKCLEKDRALRYRNVAELVDELVAFAAPGSQPRTDRIRRLVMEGGESVRPPRSMGLVTPFEVIRPVFPARHDLIAAVPMRAAASPPPALVSPRAAWLSEGNLTSEPPDPYAHSESGDAPARKWLPFAAAGALVVLLAVIGAALLLTRASPSTAPAATSAPSPVLPNPMASAMPVSNDPPGSTAASALVPEETAPVTSSATKTAPPLDTSVTAQLRPAAPPSASTSAARVTAPPPPSPEKKRPTDYSEFGERR
jgi:serine/threonine protein kinase